MDAMSPNERLFIYGWLIALTGLTLGLLSIVR